MGAAQEQILRDATRVTQKINSVRIDRGHVPVVPKGRNDRRMVIVCKCVGATSFCVVVANCPKDRSENGSCRENVGEFSARAHRETAAKRGNVGRRIEMFIKRVDRSLISLISTIVFQNASPSARRGQANGYVR